MMTSRRDESSSSGSGIGAGVTCVVSATLPRLLSDRQSRNTCRLALRTICYPRPPRGPASTLCALSLCPPLPVEAHDRHGSSRFLASAPRLVQDRNPVKSAQCTFFGSQLQGSKMRGFDTDQGGA